VSNRPSHSLTSVLLSIAVLVNARARDPRICSRARVFSPIVTSLTLSQRTPLIEVLLFTRAHKVVVLFSISTSNGCARGLKLCSFFRLLSAPSPLPQTGSIITHCSYYLSRVRFSLPSYIACARAPHENSLFCSSVLQCRRLGTIRSVANNAPTLHFAHYFGNVLVIVIYHQLFYTRISLAKLFHFTFCETKNKQSKLPSVG